MKQNVKTALVRLAFLIDAHQNANQKPIAGAVYTSTPGAVYTSTPADLQDPSFLIFRGSGFETR